MGKNIFVLVFIVLFLISCQTGKEDAKKFADDFSNVINKLTENRSKVKTRDQYAAFKVEKKKEFETLLKKYEKSPSIEGIEILRSKILFKLDKLDDAEKKIDNVLAGKPELINEAKIVKVLVLLEKEKFSEAYDIFKDIEPKIKNPDDLFDVYYKLGSEHEDNKVKEEYSKKFLESKQIPGQYIGKKHEMYVTLASVAKEREDLDEARRVLKKGVGEIEDSRKKAFLEKCLKQIDFIGEKALPISAETWLNSSALKLENLKGKAVLIAFWAPWCPYCRKTVPTLVEEYNKNKDRGLLLIGYTRLYGKYRDDVEDKGKVSKDEEIENIKNYLDRNKISYPVAVKDDKSDFDKYKVPGIPALVFIDKKGAVDYIKIGGSSRFIKNRIKKLLEKS